MVREIQIKTTVMSHLTLVRLGLVDRVPDELCMEVCYIVQEMGIRTIPKKKKCEKAK